MSKEIILEVANLKKAFGKNQVLKGVNFHVRKGQIFSLLGSNGAGKTTAVRIMTTLLGFDEGTVTICGYDILKESTKVRQCISLTGQYAAVDEMLTARENLKLVAKLRHLKGYADRIEELLRMFELTEAADKLVKTYSGGMRRKVDIAMSLLGDPQIIFLDEPTTGLDPQSRLKLWGMIEGLKAKGTTIFLTTQYLEEAERLADYIAILNEGEIVVGGTLAELKKHMPEWKPVMVETSPSLEDIFLAIVDKKEAKK